MAEANFSTADADSDNAEATQPEGGPSNAPALGVLEEVQLLWAALRGLVVDHLQLAALETQRLGESLVIMLVCAVFIGVLLVSAWIGLAGVLVLGLMHFGMLASFALLIAVAFNLLGVIILVKVIRSRSNHLRFPATFKSLQQLRGSSLKFKTEENL